MKYLFPIFTLIVFLSCGESRNILSQDRILHVYELDTLSYKYQYELKITDGEIIRYHYENKTDHLKNMTFSYDDENKSILFAGDKYEIYNKDGLYIPQLKDYIFSFYNNSASASDASDPILFNKDYGVLAIGNSMTPNFIYLKEDDVQISKMLNPKL